MKGLDVKVVHGPPHQFNSSSSSFCNRAEANLAALGAKRIAGEAWRGHLVFVDAVLSAR